MPYPLLPSGLGSHKPCDANGRGRKNLSAWDWACSGGAHCCSDGSVDKPPGAPGSPDPPNSSHYGPSAARCCVGAERRQVPSPPAMADPGTPTGAGEAARVRGKAIRPAAGIPREHPRHNYRAPSFFPPSGSSAPHSPSYTPSPAAGGRVQVGASTQGPALPPPPNALPPHRRCRGRARHRPPAAALPSARSIPRLGHRVPTSTGVSGCSPLRPAPSPLTTPSPRSLLPPQWFIGVGDESPRAAAWKAPWGCRGGTPRARAPAPAAGTDFQPH